MRVGQLVSFLHLKNARGYPLTGQIEEIVDSQHVRISAWGLYGPGSETIINDVPVNEIKIEEFRLNNDKKEENDSN